MAKNKSPRVKINLTPEELLKRCADTPVSDLRNKPKQDKKDQKDDKK